MSRPPAPRTPADDLALPAVPAVAPASVPLLPGERTRSRRIRFLAVNACTVSSLALGMLSIFLGMRGHVSWAAICLVACVAFDGVDGALARRLGVASPFGAQMDSLADMSSFGVATPVLVYSWLHGSAPMWLVAPSCALVAICAAIRLARFNVSPKDGRFFSGVPTTMASAIVALAALVLRQPASWHVAVVAVLGLLMVSSFPYAKLARILRLPPWLAVVPAVGLLLDIRITFGLVIAAYLISGPVLWLGRRRLAV